MAYESKDIRRQKVRYNDDNDDNVITYQRVTDGAKVTPSSATITVYKPGESTAVLTATAMTISGTLSTYAIDTTTVADFPVDTGYRARIAATVSGTVYLDDIYFDVVKYLLLLPIGRDQLVALDDRVDGMEHAGDDDFSEVIEAVRDELQIRIENKVLGDGKLLENMILDNSRVAIPARYRILAQIFETKRDFEQADRYNAMFEEVWRETLNSIQYDKDQDLEEDAKIGGLQGVRLVY